MVDEFLRKIAFALEQSGVPYMLTGSLQARYMACLAPRTILTSSWRRLSPEDLLIAKLEWAQAGGSERQIEDAAGILRLQSTKLDYAYIDRWVTSLGLAEPWLAAQRKAQRLT